VIRSGMKPSPVNLLTMTFLFLVLAGIVLITLSFLSSQQENGAGRIIRSVGFALLFFGIGEYLNHPPLVENRPAADQGKTVRPAGKRTRTPCGLGNLFDILAIISIFIVASYLLFPGKQ